MREDITSFPPQTRPFNIQMTGISYCDESYCINRPNSKIYCFEYILEGSGYVNQNEIEFMAKKGDIYILSANKNHYYYSDRNSPWIKIWFNIYGDFVDKIMGSYGIDQVSHIKNYDISSLFYDFLNQAKSSEPIQEIFDKCACIFLEIVQKISKINNVLFINPVNNEIAVNLKHEIDEMSDYKISFDEIVNKVFCSKSHAIRVFKEEFKITPYQYILSKKVSIAKIMLRNTNMPIGEIADYLGFCDNHYFSSFFKQQVGIAPKEYRRST